MIRKNAGSRDVQACAAVSRPPGIAKNSGAEQAGVYFEKIRPLMFLRRQPPASDNCHPLEWAKQTETQAFRVWRAKHFRTPRHERGSSSKTLRFRPGERCRSSSCEGAGEQNAPSHSPAAFGGDTSPEAMRVLPAKTGGAMRDCSPAHCAPAAQRFVCEQSHLRRDHAGHESAHLEGTVRSCWTHRPSHCSHSTSCMATQKDNIARDCTKKPASVSRRTFANAALPHESHLKLHSEHAVVPAPRLRQPAIIYTKDRPDA